MRSRMSVIAKWALAACLFTGCVWVSGVQAQAGAASGGSAAAGRWRIVDSENRPIKRYENAYVRVGEKFYLVGGRYERPVQIFTPADNRWTTASAPPFQMHHFQAVEFGGLIYVLGAFTENYPREKGLPNVYIYDPAADAWTKGPEIPESRRRGAAGAVVYGRKIYVVCGIVGGHGAHAECQAWLDEFDPQTGKWTEMPDAPHVRDHFQAAVVGDKLYAVGGRNSGGAGNFFAQTVTEVDVYDFLTGKWFTLPARLPTGRAAPAAAVLGNEILVMGGESAQPNAHTDTEALDVTNNTWRKLAPLVQGRHGTQAIVWNGRVYIAAGSKTRGESEINSQEVFSIAKN
jgi:N-acetylneuraminic acid mutarotase